MENCNDPQLQSMMDISKRKRTSHAWRYFTEMENQKAMCNYCGAILSMNGGPNNLVRHVKNKHSTLLKSGEEKVDVTVSGDGIKMNGSSDEELDDQMNVTLKKPSKRFSKSWKYFTDLGNNRAKCTICTRKVRFTNGPSNLKRHIKAIHPELLGEFLHHNKQQRTEVDRAVESIEEQASTPNIIVERKYRRQPVSHAWFYFTKLPMNKAKCKFCYKIMSVSCGAHNLLRHTKAFHKNLLRDSKESIRVSYETASEVVSLKDEKTIISPAKSEQLGSPKRIPATRTKSINKALMELICKEYLPFDLVESRQFVHFVELLNPTYELPTRNILSNHHLATYYNTAKETIANELVEAKYIAISTDCWTTKANENFISVTAHYINGDTVLKSHFLDCEQFNEQQSGKTLNDKIIEICNNWNILEKVVAATTDNCTDILCAINGLFSVHIPCVAHILNAIIRNGLDVIQATHGKVRHLVELFAESPLDAEMLKSTQRERGEPEVNLKSDVESRWTSTYAMFKRVLDCMDSIRSTIEENYPAEVCLTPDDEEVLKEGCELLWIFDNICAEMSTDENVTVSEIVVILNALVKHCQGFLGDEKPPLIIEMAKVLIENIHSYYPDYEVDEVYAINTILDPRFNRHAFSSDDLCDKVVEMLRIIVNNEQPDYPEITVEVGHPSSSTSPTTSKKIRSSWCYDFEIKAASLVQINATGNNEVDRYLDEPLIPRTNDPLDWWDRNKTSYPRMYNLILKRLCIAATSIPPGHIFSKSGQAAAARRNLLCGRKVSPILFLNNNM